MAGTFRQHAFAFILFAMAPSAAAQGRAGLDLNGLWELVESGARADAKNAIVKITHAGATVTATFIFGAACSGGERRPDTAFVAALRVQPTLPPTGQLSSSSMWVCSGDTELVRRCGGRIKMLYQTTFTNATVEQDFIDGTRVRQGVRDCRLDASSNGTAGFALRRLAPCELEERRVAEDEDYLYAVLNTILGTARVVLRTAIESATARYGEDYVGPTGSTIAALHFPYNAMSHHHGYTDTGAQTRDVASAEAFFANLAEVIALKEWGLAREMATAMGLKGMLQELHRIEQTAPDGYRAVTLLRNARRALEECRKAQ